MSLINHIEPDDATGEVARVYAEAQQMLGFVPNGIKLHSINPLRLSQLWQYIGSVMQHPTLSPQLFALIRLLVSVDQRCDYCIDLNEGMLVNDFGLTPEQVAAVKDDPKKAPLEPREQALLDLCLQAVRDSNGVAADDIQRARDQGASDAEIYDAVAHAANQVAGDILLNAFGVAKDF